MAVSVSIAPATHEHVGELVRRLRPVEAAEMRAATGREPMPIIINGLRDSTEAWSVFIEDELAMMGGVILARGPEGLRFGIGWLLTTDVVERRKKTFWRLCCGLLPAVLSRWDEVANAIDCRHELAIRWATRLGFRLDPPLPIGVAGEPFQVFHVNREDVLCALQR